MTENCWGGGGVRVGGVWGNGGGERQTHKKKKKRSGFGVTDIVVAVTGHFRLSFYTHLVLLSPPDVLTRSVCLSVCLSVSFCARARARVCVYVCARS